MTNYIYSPMTTTVGTTSTTYTIGTSSGSNGSWLTSSSTGGSNWASVNYTQPSLQVTGDADFSGDVRIKGVSVVETLDAINKRLAILVPDPKKLEHFEALQKAYKHYKVLEALCELPTKD